MTTKPPVDNPTGGTTEETQATTAPAQPKYRYIGPDAEQVEWPRYRLVFRPRLATDNQIKAILDRYPDLSRYFEHTAGSDIA